MFYKIILFISVIDLFLAIYFQGNILKSILYLVFSIGLILRDKYEKWRQWLDVILIFLVGIFFYTDWFL